MKKVQEILESPELKIAKGVDTRWLSHKAAVSTLLKSFTAVIVFLQQQSDPNAIGLCEIITRYNFFASLLLLNESVSCRLSLAFQRTTVDLTTISPLLNSTVTALENLKGIECDQFEKDVKSLIAKTTTEVRELQVHHSDEEQEIGEDWGAVCLKTSLVTAP